MLVGVLVVLIGVGVAAVAIPVGMAYLGAFDCQPYSVFVPSDATEPYSVGCEHLDVDPQPGGTVLRCTCPAEDTPP